MDRPRYSNVLAGEQMVPDHTVVALVDATYQMLRAALGARQTFFTDVRTLMRYFVFARWDHLIEFMSPLNTS